MADLIASSAVSPMLIEKVQIQSPQRKRSVESDDHVLEERPAELVHQDSLRIRRNGKIRSSASQSQWKPALMPGSPFSTSNNMRSCPPSPTGSFQDIETPTGSVRTQTSQRISANGSALREARMITTTLFDCMNLWANPTPSATVCNRLSVVNSKSSKCLPDDDDDETDSTVETVVQISALTSLMQHIAATQMQDPCLTATDKMFLTQLLCELYKLPLLGLMPLNPQSPCPDHLHFDRALSIINSCVSSLTDAPPPTVSGSNLSSASFTSNNSSTNSFTSSAVTATKKQRWTCENVLGILCSAVTASNPQGQKSHVQEEHDRQHPHLQQQKTYVDSVREYSSSIANLTRAVFRVLARSQDPAQEIVDRDDDIDSVPCNILASIIDELLVVHTSVRDPIHVFLCELAQEIPCGGSKYSSSSSGPSAQSPMLNLNDFLAIIVAAVTATRERIGSDSWSALYSLVLLFRKAVNVCPARVVQQQPLPHPPPHVSHYHMPQHTHTPPPPKKDSQVFTPPQSRRPQPSRVTPSRTHTTPLFGRQTDHSSQLRKGTNFF